ncbi:NACHT domain-containing protein [Streptomyces sp. NPDC005279]|uniref:NACHT domain-containing protein n=1 Tax=Streptomyces sp. NPDC005279 TaxID=3364712 RepID=UPI0036AC5978
MSNIGEERADPVIRIGVQANDHASVNALGHGVQINIERLTLHRKPHDELDVARLRNAFFQGILRNPKISQWRGDRAADHYDFIVPGRAQGVNLLSRSFLRDRVVSLPTLMDQGITSEKRDPILILGDSGSGKTTTLQHQCLRQALAFTQGKPCVPVVPVSLNHYSGDLLETIQASINAVGGLDLAVDEAYSFVRTAGAVLCFDGLNELGRFRDQGVRQISALISAMPQLLCVVTCRWDEYGDDFEWDFGWRILPLRRINIEEYLTWHSGTRGARVFQEIVQEGLADMTANPLILRMLRETMPGALPKQRGPLYAMFVETMLRRQGAKGRRGTQIPYDVRRRAFDFLAHHMQQESTTRYSTRQVADTFSEFLTSWHEDHPWRLLLDYCVSSGLLINESGSYTFLHQTVQEYFAASALEEGDINDVVGDESILGQVQWNEVLLLLAGITRSPSKLVMKLAANDPVMAVKCISHGASPNAETMDALLRELQQMAVSPSWVARRTSADLMGELGWPSAHPALLPLLRDENDEVRWGAVYALKNIGDGEVAAPELMERLHDKFWVTQGEAAETVAQLGILQAIPTVVGMLASENSYVRACATHSLLVFYQKSPEGREGIRSQFGNAGAEQQKLICFAISVAEADGEQAIQLESALASESTQVVEAAIRILVLHPGTGSAAKIASHASSPYASVRATAVSALGKLQACAFASLVGQTLLTDEEAQVRGTAATALAAMYAEKAPDFLLRAVGDNSSEVRFALARSMARLRLRAARPQLRAWATDDPDVRVRVHAIRALGFLGVSEDLEFLTACNSQENDPQILDSIQEALGNITHGHRRIDF